MTSSSSRTNRFRQLAPVFGATLAVASAGVVATTPSAAAAPPPGSCDTSQPLVVCDYTQIGQYQLVIPEGVERISVLATAGAGGAAAAAGGFGHQVVDFLEVTEGDLLFVNVGGAAFHSDACPTSAECQGGYGEGGFGADGGGGGGASDVRTRSASQSNSQSSRLIVAGGGGGAAGSGGGGAGGNAGAAGSAGTGAAPGGGGGPGTQAAAGDGGSPDGTAGFLDKGGSNLGNAGAGGGGYFGGGSGGTGSGGGGGGGGSSLVAHADSAQVSVATEKPGRVLIRYAVEDREAPRVDVYAPSPQEATNNYGAPVTYSAYAHDSVDGGVPVSCTPGQGEYFPIGTTTITCSATDVSGNTGHGTFDVVVRDTTPPELDVPTQPMEVTATSSAGAQVPYSIRAYDQVAGPLRPTCDPPSGSTFPLGNTTVSCSVEDGYHNVTTGGFVITVVDKGAPELTVPGDRTVDATGPGGATVTFEATASDAISPPATVECSPASGSLFGFGATAVGCTATDRSGNTTTKGFTVTVVDTTAPSLSLPAAITVPASSASGATVSYATSANDLVDGSRAVSCSPGSGTVFPVGTTTVTCTASDTRSNTATGTFTVTVDPYRADLDVTVKADRASTVRGETVQYTVTVTNRGGSTATNVRTVLAVAGLSVTSTSPTTASGTVKVQGVTYTGALWTTASIPSGGSVTFTLKGTVTAKKGDAVAAQGATTSDVPDPVTTDNVTTVRVPVTR